MRKLATIQQIQSIVKHPNADTLHIVKVMGWNVVVRLTDDLAPGSKVVYFEIDSVLPADNPAFNFMAKHKYRVRTIKLRGEISQGLVMPLAEVGLNPDEFMVGDDVTEQLGVTKWLPADEREPQMLPHSKDKHQQFKNGGHGLLAFPIQLVDKTDEPRIQSNAIMIEGFKGKPWQATLKVDGTSATYLIDPSTDKFVVCSRNLQRPDEPAPETPTVKNGMIIPDSDVYWGCVRKYDIENVLRRNKNVAIQGEIYGPKINGNRLEVAEQLFAVFNVADIHTKHVYGFEELKQFCSTNNLPMVPLVEQGDAFNFTMDELIEKAKGLYPNSKNPREGLVFRLNCMDNITIGHWTVRPSFKIINNDYLLKFNLYVRQFEMDSPQYYSRDVWYWVRYQNTDNDAIQKFISEELLANDYEADEFRVHVNDEYVEVLFMYPAPPGRKYKMMADTLMDHVFDFLKSTDQGRSQGVHIRQYNEEIMVTPVNIYTCKL